MTALADDAAPQLRAARRATRVQFAALGFLTGTWGAHIPSAKAHYGLDEAGLSLALLAAAFGAVGCLLVAGRVVSRFGARAVAALAAGVLCASLGAVIVPTAPASLMLLMLAFGAASALFDVAINAEGTVLEARSRRKVMSGFHGMFSLGGMAGAAVAALLLAAGVPPARQLAGVGVAIGVLAAVAVVFMLPAHPPEAGRRSAYRLPRGPLALIGLLAALGLLAEGAVYDWSVLYLQTQTGAPSAQAALAYASFSLAMAATRFAGDRLRSHISPARLLAASAGFASAAMAALLLVRDPLLGIVGFALVGAGLANVVPILFIAATRVPGVAPATAIATVSSLGYLGFLVGPPLVGGIASASSLSQGLAVVVVAAALLAWGARRLPT